MIKIAGILLAAGASKRYGGNKLLASHYTGQSLIAYSAEQLRQLRLSQFYIVTGRWHQQLESELFSMQRNVVYNENWQHGIATSIRAGLNEALVQDNSITHVLITLADLAHVTTSSLYQLISTAEKFPNAVVYSQWAQQTSVPAIFPRHCFRMLLNISGDKGAKGIINRFKEEGQAIGVNHPEAQYDIDMKSDWSK